MTDIKVQQYQKVLDKALATDDSSAIIAAYIELGQAYLEIKDTPKGYTQYDQALKVAEKAKDLRSETYLHGMVGICLKQLGNYDTAMQSLRKSLRIARKIEDTFLEGDALYQIGALLVDQGEPLEAISHLDNALILSLHNLDHKRKLAATNLMGNIFLGLESIDKAIENYATALDAAKTLNDKEAEAASRIHLGQTFLLDEDFDAAIENFELGLEIANKLSLAAIEMQALYGLTQSWAGSGKTSLAVVYGEQLINKAKQANAHAEEIQALQTVVEIHSKNEQVAKAIPFLKRGLEIAKEKKDNDWEIKFLTDLGYTFYLEEDLEEAFKYLDEAYNNAVRFQLPEEEALIAGRIAALQADRGEWESAIKFGKRSIELADELEAPILKGEQLVLLGMNYQDQDDLEKARKCFGKSKELYLDIERDDLVSHVEKLLESISGE